MRVLLADDHALFRAGIASLLEAWGNEVVAQAGNGREAFELACQHGPDLVLMDIGMPECNGLEATRLIKTARPEIKIVIVTVSDDDDDLFEAIKSGAEGYLLKNLSEEELSHTLQAVAAGESALSPALAARIIGEFARPAGSGPARDVGDDLTAREREVLQLVAAGSTNREIAAALVVSESTINFHMKNILAKLHLKNRTQAVAHAIRTGLVDVHGA